MQVGLTTVPAAKVETTMVSRDPARKLMYGSPLYLFSPSVKLMVAVTFVAGSGPVLQSLAPIGKFSGPEVTSLLSSPMTFQVMGAIDNSGADLAVRRGKARDPNSSPNMRNKRKKTALLRVI